MKSITQINLARLTVRKSLSKTDSAQLQPPALITIGGAIHTNTHSPSSVSAEETQLHKNTRYLAASQNESAVRNLPTALK